MSGRLPWAMGVQNPSADPHIELFDDPGLFVLAGQFPAVVARAWARQEEKPRRLAYVKPTPGAAPAAADRIKPERQQSETLRLF